MGLVAKAYEFAAGAVPTAANWNANPDAILAEINGNLDAANVDEDGVDGIVTKNSTQTITGAKTYSAKITFNAKLDMNGTEIILDADADSSITADTDDLIDFRVSGSDRVKFKGGATATVPTGQFIGANSGAAVDCVDVYNSGTGAASTIARISFSALTATTPTERRMAYVDMVVTDEEDASYTADLAFKVAYNATGPSELMRLTTDGSGDGRLGVNTTAPGAVIHAHNPTTASQIWVTTDANTGNATLWLGYDYDASVAQQWAGIRLNGTSDKLVFFNADNEQQDLAIDANANVLVGAAAILTTATNGFLYIPTCAGTPTGTPTTHTGLAPLVVDSTNNLLYFYSGGAWVAAT